MVGNVLLSISGITFGLDITDGGARKGIINDLFFLLERLTAAKAVASRYELNCRNELNEGEPKRCNQRNQAGTIDESGGCQCC